MDDVPLPKGMSPPASETPDPPPPYDCTVENYAGVLRLLLTEGPVACTIRELVVTEQPGQPPRIQVDLDVYGIRPEPDDS